MTTKIVRQGHSHAYRFDDLCHGEWYIGAETGKLYFYFESPEGKPRLFRFEDNIECTNRYQRAGSFYKKDVVITVDTSRETDLSDDTLAAQLQALEAAVRSAGMDIKWGVNEYSDDIEVRLLSPKASGQLEALEDAVEAQGFKILWGCYGEHSDKVVARLRKRD